MAPQETEQERANRLNCMIQCYDCGHWNKWTTNEEGHSFFLDKTRRSCENCESAHFDWRTIVSIKTWDPKRKKVRRRDS